ncbi:MAG: M48 family metalloprotease [Calditrichaeota bacterium]|nr:M48 family metalloprotease [Calditrichota bacterium]
MKKIYILIALSLLALLIYCAVNPVTGKRQLMLLSQSDEIALGQQTDKQVMQTYGIYNDPALNAYVNGIGQRMAKLTHRPNLKYSFKVLDTPMVNAFAVPGGYLYFTRGILCYLNNEAELAGVMGHELGHVNARHTAVQYSRTQLAQLGLGVGMIFSEKFRQYAGLAQFGVGMLFLRFSRDNERQADDLGVEYSLKDGYNPDYMASFFETLDRMNPGSDRSGLPSWFSTHPNPVDRVVAVQQKTKELEQKIPHKNLAVKRDEYLQKIDGLTFGDDPRQGYVEGNTFYHPQLDFTFPLPPDWKLNNTPSQVQIVSPKQDAAILLTIESANSPLEASRQFTGKSSAQILSSDNIRVNGLSAQRVVCDVPSRQDTVRVMSYFIQKDNKIFVFHGFAPREQFSAYRSNFNKTMSKFGRIKDRRKLNAKPQRVHIRKIRSTGTLRNALQKLGVRSVKLEEMALLNGMHLNDRVKANLKIKLIGK